MRDADFACDVLLPAVRANTSLRSLQAFNFGNDTARPYQEPAKELVAKRAASLPAEEEGDDDVW